MNQKHFIITIDTEEDNQWDTSSRNTTSNAAYIPRFQALCEKYGFIPVYLTTYGVAGDPEFVRYIKPKVQQGLCEMGMHLHAWSTPPEYELKRINDKKSYLIEYPVPVMRHKIREITELLENTFECKMTSHRAGRWAMNDAYFELLSEFGYRVDCSVTPHISWKTSLGATGMPGTDYRGSSEKPYYINDSLLEVPVTIRPARVYEPQNVWSAKTLLKEIISYMKKKSLWLRPDGRFAEHELLKLISLMQSEAETDYLMFMLHSSELMPGGSPYFKDEESIERLYKLLDRIFGVISENYVGISLMKYCEISAWRKKNE
jgi:hypothetical protein